MNLSKKLKDALSLWNVQTLLLVNLFLLISFVDIWTPGVDIFRFGKMRALFLAGAFASYFLLKKIVPQGIALFFAYAAVLWNFTGTPVYGLGELTCMLAAILFASFLVGRIDQENFGKWLVNFALFESFYSILQIAGKDPFLETLPGWANVPVGTFGHPTVLGPFLAMALAPALWQKRWFASGVILGVILKTDSTMSILSGLVVLSLFIIQYLNNFGRLLYFGGGAVAAFIAYLLHPSASFFSLTGRPYIWGKAFEAFAKAPLFGGGPGYWSGYYAPFIIGPFDQWSRAIPTMVHSDFLQTAVDYGSFGFLLVLFFLVEVFSRFRLSWTYAGLCSILFNALANFSLHIATTGTLALIFLLYAMKRDTDGPWGFHKAGGALT